MSVEAILIILLVGAIAGWLAGLIVRGAGFGLIGDIVIGIIGAFIAGWLLPRLGIAIHVVNPIVTSIITATIGAVILLLIIRLIRRR
jgi:uncharacterized membrane protein YeaQ/YmgE (transglycosylase-associated protein family)